MSWNDKGDLKWIFYNYKVMIKLVYNFSNSNLAKDEYKIFYSLIQIEGNLNFLLQILINTLI